MAEIGDRGRTTTSALERRLKRLGLTGEQGDWADRYLLCEHVIAPETARNKVAALNAANKLALVRQAAASAHPRVTVA